MFINVLLVVTPLGGAYYRLMAEHHVCASSCKSGSLLTVSALSMCGRWRSSVLHIFQVCSPWYILLGCLLDSCACCSPLLEG